MGSPVLTREVAQAVAAILLLPVSLAMPVLPVHAETDTEIAEDSSAIGCKLRLSAVHRRLISQNCAVVGDLISVQLRQGGHQSGSIRLEYALGILPQSAEIECHLHPRQAQRRAIRRDGGRVAGLLIGYELRAHLLQVGEILSNGDAIGLNSRRQRSLRGGRKPDRRRHQRHARHNDESVAHANLHSVSNPRFGTSL